MTYTLLYKPRFIRRLHKLVAADRSLRSRVEKTLGQLEKNPMHPGLRTHKITRITGDSAFTARVTGNLRIIWEFNGQHAHMLDILDMGGHEGSKKVYRR